MTTSTEVLPDSLNTSDNTDHFGRLGSYEIVEVIGRGGMGIEQRGIDSRLNRVGTIKVLAPELTSTPNARQRFYREGHADAAGSHDNVVTMVTRCCPHHECYDAITKDLLARAQLIQLAGIALPLTTRRSSAGLLVGRGPILNSMSRIQ